jgi:hypothetical protein
MEEWYRDVLFTNLRMEEWYRDVLFTNLRMEIKRYLISSLCLTNE